MQTNSINDKDLLNHINENTILIDESSKGFTVKFKGMTFESISSNFTLADFKKNNGNKLLDVFVSNKSIIASKLFKESGQFLQPKNITLKDFQNDLFRNTIFVNYTDFSDAEFSMSSRFLGEHEASIEVSITNGKFRLDNPSFNG